VAGLAATLTAVALVATLTQPAAASRTTVAGWSTAAEAAPATPVTAARAPVVRWHACRDGFECARFRVPLDYGDPDGPTIVLSVVRMPAGDTTGRLGALFLNPGGPGGSGVEIARGLAQFLPLELRRRFDIVGMDPRGIMRSTPLRCYERFKEAFADQPSIPFPRTDRQERAWIEANQRFGEACRTHGGPIRQHMSTADVARDMDYLRQAMGDSQLSFLGYSYGSVLGQTYANMFPAQSRAIVVDGVLDPVAWTTGSGDAQRAPVTQRVRSAEGARSTLRAFFRLCDRAGAQCAFSGGARERYAALARQLRRNPIDFGGGDRFTYAHLVALTLGALYSAYSFPDLAAFLRDLESAASPPRLRAGLARLRTHLGLAQQLYPNVFEGFPGVLCSDSTNPRRWGRWRAAADETARTQGRFGRLWLWQGSACGAWPSKAGRDRYEGPWDRTTANPVLVVGNLHDPSTPYSGAEAAHALLPGSALLTYTGWGHTAFFTGNYCVDQVVTDYLVTTDPPAEGTTCRPAGSPFGPLHRARAVDAQVLATALAPTLPAAVRIALAP
jgi:pimeloyl-ACP methyl ester carboxylesterase